MKAMWVLLVVCVAACGNQTSNSGEGASPDTAALDTADVAMEVAPPDSGCDVIGFVGCGDGICGPGEDLCNCPDDCPQGPNGCCSDEDCPPTDCGPCCLDFCGAGHLCKQYTVDNCCGNENCDEGENPCDCPDDCLPGPSGDGCCLDEDCPPSECGPCCTDYCDEYTCGVSLVGDCCGNEECEEGETWGSCPDDCPPPVCGNEECEEGETWGSCPDDCPPPVCGDGVCEEGETWNSCLDDCPMPSTECGQMGGACASLSPICPEGTYPSSYDCDWGGYMCCHPDGIPPPPGCEDWKACTVDGGCVGTKGDCCGCSSGGISTAIKAECAEAWLDQFKLISPCGCTDVVVCDWSDIPACVQGKCVLL